MNNKWDINVLYKNIECFALCVFSIFFAGAFIVTLYHGWSPVILILCLTAFGSGWGLFLTKKLCYYRRSFATVLFANLIVLCILLMRPRMHPFLFVFIALLAVTGIYGLKELLWIPIITQVLIFFFLGYMAYKKIPMCEEVVSEHIVIFSVLFVIDVTVLSWIKRNAFFQEQLVQTKMLLDSVKMSQEEFLVNVGREVKKPANLIGDMCYALQDEKDLFFVQNQLRNMRATALRLIGNVEDMEDFATFKMNQIVTVKTQYQTEDIIENIRSICVAFKSQKNIDVILDVDATLPETLYGDWERVCRSVCGMIDNSMKFTKEGGIRINVTWAREKEGEDISLIFTITDTGDGIKPHRLSTIRKYFKQVDMQHIPEEYGKALKLIMAQITTTSMGGQLSIQSKYGEGVTATIIIPQKVISFKPIQGVYNKKVIALLDKEAIRNTLIEDAYEQMFEHMSEQLKTRFVYCDSILTFQRKIQNEDFDHVLVSSSEYRSYKQYFDEISQWHNVIVMVDGQEKDVDELYDVKRMVAPFYVKNIIDGFSLKLQPTPSRMPSLQESLHKANEIVTFGKKDIRLTEEETAPQEEKIEEVFLDEELGITYCGSPEDYEEILQEYAAKGKKNWALLEELYQEEDWDSYTIEVHGIKSATLTIGAKTLSEKAKKLEMAGKEGDISYIKSNHEALLLCYEKVIRHLCHRFEYPFQEEHSSVALSEHTVEWSEDQIKECLEKMEDAAFMLDKEQMLAIGEALKDVSFQGQILGECYEDYIRKVQRMDLLSAWEMIKKKCNM